MGLKLIDEIKKDAIKSRSKIQTSEERELEGKLNRLFYLDKKIEEETEFVRSVMTRGQETAERRGLHASAIIVSDDKFCYRQQVLSLFYRQKQGEQIQPSLRRIFVEGDSVHEKWQRLFIRGGYAMPEECDKTQYDKRYDLQFTPDIICTIDAERMVGEIKSVNSASYNYMKNNGKAHPSGKKQLFLYMYLTGIHRGFVLCEDKNMQDFRANIYDYDKKEVDPYIERLEKIQEYKRRLREHNRMVRRHEKCVSYDCEMASVCPMSDVCYGTKKELL